MVNTTANIVMLTKELSANWQLPIACGLRFSRIPTIITPKGKVPEFISLIKPENAFSQLGNIRPDSQAEPNSSTIPMGTLIFEIHTTCELQNTLDVIWPIFKGQHIECGVVSNLPIFVTDQWDIEDPEKRLFLININIEFTCLYEQPYSAVIYKETVFPPFHGKYYDIPMQLRKTSDLQMYQVLCWAAYSLFVTHKQRELLLEDIDLVYHIVEADATFHGWLESESTR